MTAEPRVALRSLRGLRRQLFDLADGHSWHRRCGHAARVTHVHCPCHHENPGGSRSLLLAQPAGKQRDHDLGCCETCGARAACRLAARCRCARRCPCRAHRQPVAAVPRQYRRALADGKKLASGGVASALAAVSAAAAHRRCVLAVAQRQAERRCSCVTLAVERTCCRHCRYHCCTGCVDRALAHLQQAARLLGPRRTLWLDCRAACRHAFLGQMQLLPACRNDACSMPPQLAIALLCCGESYRLPDTRL